MTMCHFYPFTNDIRFLLKISLTETTITSEQIQVGESVSANCLVNNENQLILVLMLVCFAEIMKKYSFSWLLTKFWGYKLVNEKYQRLRL